MHSKSTVIYDFVSPVGKYMGQGPTEWSRCGLYHHSQGPLGGILFPILTTLNSVCLEFQDPKKKNFHQKTHRSHLEL